VNAAKKKNTLGTLSLLHFRPSYPWHPCSEPHPYSHLYLNSTPVKYLDCILNSWVLSSHGVLWSSSVVVPAAVAVSRNTFYHAQQTRRSLSQRVNVSFNGRGFFIFQWHRSTESLSQIVPQNAVQRCGDEPGLHFSLSLPAVTECVWFVERVSW